MPVLYREHSPPARLAAFVECIWTLRSEAEQIHRVLPDGCSDILFSDRAGLQLVGPMTRFRDFPLAAGECLTGVRFHPGMAYLFVSIPVYEIADRAVDLSGDPLHDRLLDASREGRAELLERWLRPRIAPSPAQRVATAIRTCGGRTGVDELATQAGLSARQLRRVCLEQTGLTPKQLCRVIRSGMRPAG